MMSTTTTRPARVPREKSTKSGGDGRGPDSKIQATAEQIRIAQIINTKDIDGSDIQNKIKQVMELTGKSCDEASVALHDCDNDPNRAIEMLLDGSNVQGEWETLTKKKKNRPPAQTSNQETNANVPLNNNNKENRARNERLGMRDGIAREGIRNRAPPRMSRGRGHDVERNERNLENQRDRISENRGRGYRFMNGGGGGGRAGRGGRFGVGARFRTFQNRGGGGGGGGSSSQSEFPRSIDTWSNVNTEASESTETPMHVGNWSDKDGFPAAEDWDNEDWAGSLSETKVFTSSVSTTDNVTSDLNGTQPESELGTSLEIQQEILSSSLSSSGPQSSSNLTLQFVPSHEITEDVPSPVIAQITSAPLYPVLTSASSAIDNPSLVQATTSVSSPLTTSVTLPIGSGLAGSGMPKLLSSIANQQPAINSRPKSHRTKSLASSKIPSSAVEMPDDTIANLDVQFGSLDFGSEPSTISFSSVLESSVVLPSVIPSSSLTNHVSTLAGTQSLGNSVLHLSSATLGKSSSDMVGAEQSSHVSYQSAVAAAASLGIGGNSVKEMVHGVSSPQPSLQDLPESSLPFVNQPERKTAPPFSTHRVSQSTILDGSLSSCKLVDNSALSAYNVPSTNIVNHSNYQSGYGAHKPASSPFIHHTNLPNSTPQSQMSLYGTSFSSVASPSAAYGGVSQGTYAAPISTVSTYVSSSSMSQASSYTSRGHSTLHSSSMSKLPSSLSSVKDSLDSSTGHVYDMSHTTTPPNLTSTLTTASNVASSLGLTAGNLSGANPNVTKSALSSGKTGVQSLPQGVPAVLSHQYIMGQAGLPFYSVQQPVYTYEDIQLLQQRMPPMANYFDVYPPSTTLTGRDGGLGNVAYSGSDAKFNRGDNSSPVPTTLAQQQSSSQQHQQAFISPTALPPGYSYYYPGGVVASGFAQYGAPIFPMPPVSNAHAASTSSHYQKPSTYASHAYTSGYESLGQAQDYGKTGYGSSSQNQSKGLGGGTSGGSVSSVGGNDLTASVYGKTHSQMNKQPYEKPGFHAGTPPPFNMAGNQAGPMGAPSTAYAAAPFIPMMAQHHSPMMHHQLHQDSATASQRSNQSAVQNKGNASSKPVYTSSYWPPN